MIWSNGTLVEDRNARISPYDRGLTLADGVFETIRCAGSRPLWLLDHLERLRNGAAVLGIPLPLDAAAIETGIRELIAAADLAQSALRLTLTRGAMRRRGLWPEGEPIYPTLMATIAPLPPPASPLRVVVARTTRRNEHSPLSQIKSLNYGDNLIARREAAARGADDAILVNGLGRLACCSVGNLFVHAAGKWMTPPISDGVLPGLARARLIERLQAREASLDADGCVRITGRIKDLIIRGGENVAPKEIEDCLREHPSVADAYVYGIPDAFFGEAVAAAIRLKPDATMAAGDAMAWCEARIARFKVPRHVRFVAAFPMTASGKIQKYKLREEHEAMRTGSNSELSA